MILLPIFHREEFKDVSLHRINLSSGLRWRCQPRSKSLGLPWLFTQEFCRNLLAKYRLRAVTCARNCKALSKQVDKKCNKSLSRHMD